MNIRTTVIVARTRNHSLVLINEFTDLAFARDYAWLFIAAATFFGFWLAHLSGDSNTRDTGHEGTE